MVGHHGEHPRNDDEAVGYWLARLRDGGPDEQATARTELGLILERRGLVDEAIEAYQRNVMDGARDRRPYDRLAEIYRQRGDRRSEGLVLQAFASVAQGADSPTLTGLPTIPPAPVPSSAPLPMAPPTEYGARELSDAAWRGRAPGEDATQDTDGPAEPPAVGPRSSDSSSADPPSADAPSADAPSADAGLPESQALDALPPAPTTGPGMAGPLRPVPGQYGRTQGRGQPVGGRPTASPTRRGPAISPGLGILIALLGLIVLIVSIAFATLWSGGRLGSLSSGAVGASRTASPAVEPGTTDSSATPPQSATGGTVSSAVLAAPAQSPTPVLPPAECWNPSIRFPESQQPEESVRRTLLEYLGLQDASVDPDSPRVRPLLEAHAARANELLAGWMGVSLQRSQRRLQTFSLAAYIGSELLVPNEVGQYTLRATISEQGWRELQAWPATICEGAFIQRPENARWVELMRASVGDISWALAPVPAAPSPAPSPSPSPGAP